MAVSVDTVYQRVLALANKEQRGYITPQEFNLFANHAQLEIVDQYFYDINQFGRLPGNDTEYSDMLDLLNEKLGALKRNNQSVTTTNGVVTNSDMPDDVYKMGTITFAGSEVERVEHNELVQLSSSPLTAPTSKRPLYTEGSNGITIHPPLSAVKISYVKKPNNLDQQNEMMLLRLDKLEKNITSLESKMNNLNAAIKKDIEKIKNVKKR